MAETLFRHKVAQAGLEALVWTDSAGTHNYRLGERPDPRGRRVLERRGYAMVERCARQVTREDLERCDHVLAMDQKNLAALHDLAGPDLWRKPKLLMSYSQLYSAKEIADPYGADEEQFELTLDMIESATDGLLATLVKELKSRV